MRLQDPTAACTPAAGRSSGSEAQQTLLTAAWGSLGQSGSGGGLSALVQALRSTVSAGLSAGKDVAGKLAQSLDGGLQKAEQALVSQGMDAKQAAQRVATFRRELARAVHVAAVQAANQSTGAGPSAVAGPSTAVSQVPAATQPAGTVPSTATRASPPASQVSTGSAGAVSMRESLQIVTTDGARVSIRFSEQDLIAAGSDGSGNSLAALLSRGRIQISVQGTLSAGDLQAVNALVAQVDGLAQQFFSGDAQDAFNSAAALGADPTEIAQFSLRLSYAQIGVVSGPGGMGVAAPLTGAAVAAPSSSSAPTSASGVAAPSSSSAPSSTSAANPTSATQGTSPAGSALGGTSSSAPASSDQSQAASRSAQQTIGGFIQDVLGKLGSVSGTARLHFSMKWKLALLAAALPAYAPGAQSAAPATGTQLASSTLRSLAG